MKMLFLEKVLLGTYLMNQYSKIWLQEKVPQVYFSITEKVTKMLFSEKALSESYSRNQYSKIWLQEQVPQAKFKVTEKAMLMLILRKIAVIAPRSSSW
jgi:hypothetical protein